MASTLQSCNARCIQQHSGVEHKSMRKKQIGGGDIFATPQNTIGGGGMGTFAPPPKKQ